MFRTPILLIVWRRPHTLRQVIEAIRPVAPSQLYVACDGPNPDRLGEAEKVAATRILIEREIDWPCTIERLYSDTNQGCRLGVSRAITWFFGNVEKGIILEDDCVPDPTFFPFCETLLVRYANDLRVWCITGGNYQDGQVRGEGSYYFSRYPHCWGWATWRSRWHAHDDAMVGFEVFKARGLIHGIFTDPLEADYWQNLWIRQQSAQALDTWDYQWSYTCMRTSGLTVIPNTNLVTNVGDGPDATHTEGSPNLHIPVTPLSFPLVHPAFVLRDSDADRYTFYNHISGRYLRYKHSMRGRLIDPALNRLLLAFRNPSHYPLKLLRFFRCKLHLFCFPFSD